jgi:hypothetical protein
MAAFTSAIVTCTTVRALFEWRFSEVFSNADGTVQFIEIQSLGADEGQAIGGGIRSLSTGHSISLTQDLVGSTLNKKLLFATAGFGSLPGAVAPDFPTTPLAANFFNPNGDTLTLFHHGETHHGDIASRTFSSVPTDGVQSLNFPFSNFATNSPTNFAGQSGSIGSLDNFGDYNDNGMVDAADYVVYRKYLGSAATIPNDATPSGVMTGDFEVWRQRFGTASAGGASSSSGVPEPACCVLNVLLPLLFCYRARPCRHAPVDCFSMVQVVVPGSLSFGGIGVMNRFVDEKIKLVPLQAAIP